jgi:hypothetical protein
MLSFAKDRRNLRSFLEGLKSFQYWRINPLDLSLNLTYANPI